VVISRRQLPDLEGRKLAAATNSVLLSNNFGRRAERLLKFTPGSLRAIGLDRILFSVDYPYSDNRACKRPGFQSMSQLRLLVARRSTNSNTALLTRQHTNRVDRRKRVALIKGIRPALSA
jgi:hypothetical protein